MPKFWTVKIAGLSGAGKTEILKILGSNWQLGCKTITYSNLLKQFDDQGRADYELSKILETATGLVIMDEHLEFENPNKARNYVRENTRGLILLDLPAEMLINRIRRDPAKPRKINTVQVSLDLEVSRRRAVELSKELNLPLLVVPNLDGQIDGAVDLILAFLRNLNP